MQIISNWIENNIYQLPISNQGDILSQLLRCLTSENISHSTIAALFQALMQRDHFNRSNIPAIGDTSKTILEITGSGKKPHRLMNISTPSIIVAVAAGAKIIKKGSHATSSLLGSADILELLGFRIPHTLDEQKYLFDQTGFSFVNIENVIPIFNSIYSGFHFRPHILSYVLAAVVSSMRGNRIVYGLSMPDINRSLQAISELTNEDVTVYSSLTNFGECFDEIVGCGKVKIARVLNGKISESELTIDNPNLDYNKIIAPSDYHSSVLATLDVLRGFSYDSYYQIIKINAAFFLLESKVVSSFDSALLLVDESISSGKAYRTLQKIIISSGGELNDSYF